MKKKGSAKKKTTAKTRVKRPVCGAKLRGKNKTCQKPPMANGRCRLHGGATPSGPDSANFKHGRYAEAFKGQLAEKFQRADTDETPLDLLPDLKAQRVITEQYFDQISNRKKLKLSELINASNLAQDVVRSGAMIIKSRNDQALTIAEIRFFQMGIMRLLDKYVTDPNQRRDFIAELNALIPEKHAGEDAEPAKLPAGSRETSKAT
jgi:hypothetical protein